MSLLRSHKQGWAWLLALSLFGSVGGPLLLRQLPVSPCCAAEPHACCCVKAGLAHCCCAGHEGKAAQLISLSACAGTKDQLAYLVVPPLAVLPQPRIDCTRPRVGTSLAIAAPVIPSFVASPPPYPPPQAA